jgi:hypothetical protein
MCTPVVGWHFARFFPAQSMSIQYEPTLKIWTFQQGQFIVRRNDPSNAIFGFGTRTGIVSDNPLDENYNRLVLLDSLHSGLTVLKKPWVSDQFRYLGGDDSLSMDPFYNSYIDTLWRYQLRK